VEVSCEHCSEPCGSTGKFVSGSITGSLSRRVELHGIASSY
jgi:hypothetical protein